MLKDMVNCIKELLMDGKNVKIDDLGIFSVGIRSKGPSRRRISPRKAISSAYAFVPVPGQPLQRLAQADGQAP